MVDVKKCVIILCAGLLTACSTMLVSNAEKQYLQNKNGPSVVVPPPLTGANMSHFYDLPPQTQDARISIRPPEAVKTENHPA